MVHRVTALDYGRSRGHRELIAGLIVLAVCLIGMYVTLCLLMHVSVWTAGWDIIARVFG